MRDVCFKCSVLSNFVTVCCISGEGIQGSRYNTTRFLLQKMDKVEVEGWDMENAAVQNIAFVKARRAIVSTRGIYASTLTV